MKARLAILLVAASTLLGACAGPPQKPVGFDRGTAVTPSVKIGVAMTELPKVDTHFPGAGCLLCAAAAAVANSSLTDHTHTLSAEDLAGLKSEVAARLRAEGATVTLIDEPLNLDQLSSSSGGAPNLAKKDFTPLRDRYQIDKLLVINITTVGIVRPYSAYIPTSDPKATVQGTGYLVNLASNTYEWYQPVNVSKSADGQWDEAPNFPGLTNAYFQALESGKDQFLQPFAN